MIIHRLSSRGLVVWLSALALYGCTAANAFALPQPEAPVAPPPAVKSAEKKAVKTFLSPEAFQSCVDAFIKPYEVDGAVVKVTAESNKFEKVVVNQVIEHSSPAIMAAAKADGAAKERETLWDFARVLGPKFSAGSCSAINDFIEVSFIDSKRVNTAIKKQFNRPRPLEEDPENPKSNPSFPSGHSTTAGLRYRLLTAITGAGPDLEYDLAKQAWFMCYERLAVNAHFPSDIAAGFVLGEIVADEILKQAAADPSGEVGAALAAAKAQWAAAK